MKESHPEKRGIVKDLWGAVTLAVFSLAVGLAVNTFRSKPLPMVYTSKADRMQSVVTKLAVETPVPLAKEEPAVDARSQSAKIERISLEAFKERREQPGHVVLDARPEIFHRLGHVPNAIALPRDEFEGYYSKVRESLEPFKRQVVLIYCSGSACEDSELVANALVKLGFKNIAIFTGGWSEWTRENLPQQRS